MRFGSSVPKATGAGKRPDPLLTSGNRHPTPRSIGPCYERSVVHIGPQSIGTERFVAVSSGISFAQVAVAILQKQALVQNPDKDEAGGSSPPRPTTGPDQRKRWPACPELIGRGAWRIKNSYLVTAPGHEPHLQSNRCSVVSLYRCK